MGQEEARVHDRGLGDAARASGTGQKTMVALKDIPLSVRNRWAKELRRKMLGRGLSNAELARMLGASRSVVFGWANGSLPHHEILRAKVRALLGIPTKILPLGPTGPTKRIRQGPRCKQGEYEKARTEGEVIEIARRVEHYERSLAQRDRIAWLPWAIGVAAPRKESA